MPRLHSQDRHRGDRYREATRAAVRYGGRHCMRGHGGCISGTERRQSYRLLHGSAAAVVSVCTATTERLCRRTDDRSASHNEQVETKRMPKIRTGRNHPHCVADFSHKLLLSIAAQFEGAPVVTLAVTLVIGMTANLRCGVVSITPGRCAVAQATLWSARRVAAGDTNAVCHQHGWSGRARRPSGLGRHPCRADIGGGPKAER